MPIVSVFRGRHRGIRRVRQQPSQPAEIEAAASQPVKREVLFAIDRAPRDARLCDLGVANDAGFVDVFVGEPIHVIDAR